MIRVFTAKGKYISILIGVCFVCASLVFESGAVNQIGRALLGFSAGLIAFEFRALLLKHQKITVTIFLSLVPVYFFIQDLGVLSSLVTVWPFAAGIIYLSQVNTTSSASRIYTKVGKYSYGFYMWHFPMLTLAGILIKAIGLNVATLFGTLLLIVLGSILSIIATKISLVFFEQPIKKKWVNKL
jgi:peptidoglycan/LPS O-acetylase OafA/YrhL